MHKFWRSDAAANHERDMEQNKADFRKALYETYPPGGGGPIRLEERLDAWTKFEEYITKSRAADHPTVLAYGPIFTSAIGAIIAVIVAMIGIASYSREASKNNVDLALAILKESDDQQAKTNLMAFKKAGLLKLTPDEIDRLAADWKGRSTRQ